MTAQLVSLRLEPTVFKHVLVDRPASQYPRSHFLDFLIEGVSLRIRIDGGTDLATELTRFYSKEARPAVETLLGRRPAPYLEAGRVPLLVCSSCGDLECGAVTAALGLTATEVAWSALRWEWGAVGGPEPITSLPETLRFDRRQYEAELADVGRRLASLPEDEFPFIDWSSRARRSRWPWRHSRLTSGPGA